MRYLSSPDDGSDGVADPAGSAMSFLVEPTFSQRWRQIELAGISESARACAGPMKSPAKCRRLTGPSREHHIRGDGSVGAKVKKDPITIGRVSQPAPATLGLRAPMLRSERQDCRIDDTAPVNFGGPGQPLHREVTVEPLITGIRRARCPLKTLNCLGSKIVSDRHGCGCTRPPQLDESDAKVQLR
jgi:hypothetical protein